VYVGARVSSRAPDALIRPVLVVVLVASAMKLLGASTTVVGTFLGLAVAAGAVAGVVVYRRISAGDPSRSSSNSSTGSGRA